MKRIRDAVGRLIAADKKRGLATALVAIDSASDMSAAKGAAVSPQPVTFRGRVVRKRVSAGSKHEHDALVLITAEGAEYRLRRQGGNPFRDPEIDYLEGKEIECEGVEREGLVIMTTWSVFD